MRMLALIVAALAVVPAAAAKDGVTAELTSTVSADLQPGTQIDVSWKLANRDGTPFGAMGVFVRLLDARSGKPVDVTAPQSSGPFVATVRVPPGGIGGIRIGLHGSTDIFFPLKNDPFAYRHALHLPRLARGAACPVSTVDDTRPVSPRGLGADMTLRLAPAVNFDSKAWGGQKVLWVVAPSYTGPVLIRGARLDAKGDVRFDLGNVPPKELFIPRGGGDRASYTRLRAPGCYAWQVDGIGFSDIVVFRATWP
jgi:hypothetical protein